MPIESGNRPLAEVVAEVEKLRGQKLNEGNRPILWRMRAEWLVINGKDSLVGNLSADFNLGSPELHVMHFDMHRKGGEYESDGFWAVMIDHVRADQKFGEKYSEWWKAVLDPQILLRGKILSDLEFATAMHALKQ